MIRQLLVLCLGVSILGQAFGRSYVSMGEVEAATARNTTARSVAMEARPDLPGFRPYEVELLEDALQRKRPRSVGESRERAREAIIRNALRDPVKRAHIKGELAEALFLGKNPDWGYVGKPNAPEVDVYRWKPNSRRPEGAQIKTHWAADPKVYARDMVADSKADWFLVPDDHVRPLREHWEQEINASQVARNGAAEAAARRQLDRVSGLGFTTRELGTSFQRIAAYCIRERSGRYTSIGASAAMAVGPTAAELVRTGAVGDVSMRQLGRAAILVLGERGVTLALMGVRGGSLVGTAGGNALVGLGLLTIDTGLAVYEYGGHRAFSTADFYARLGGSASGLAVGLTLGPMVAGYSATAASPLGGLAPTIGTVAGIVAGALAGTAAYVGGDVFTRQLLDVLNPALTRRLEQEALRIARLGIDGLIEEQKRGSAKGSNVQTTAPRAGPG